MSVPFLDLARQTREVADDLDAALHRSLAESRFVGGAAVAEFESRWAAYCGVSAAVGCGSGAQAIALALRAAGVGDGDEVVVPANTCVPSAAGVVAAGAVPVFADADPHTLTLDPESAAAAVGPRTRAILAVHLYGRCADMDALSALAHERDLVLVEDAAHAHGATYGGRRAGSLGHVAAFSFYPTKNLGAIGDAGAVTTDDPEIARRARELRSFGRHGAQSRLATLQAAALLAKLPYLDGWNARRRTLAARYRAALDVELPPDDPGHVYHLFVVRVPSRDAVQQRLHAEGVETHVHYAPALHEHVEWRDVRRAGPLDASSRAAATVLSLPLYPQLTDAELDEVVAAL